MKKAAIIAAASLFALLIAAVATNILARRAWERRMGALYDVAEKISGENHIILSDEDLKMEVGQVVDYEKIPDPDAIVLQPPSVYLVYDPPLLNWTKAIVPRTGYDRYTLAFTSRPDGTMTVRVVHGSE